MKGDETAMRVRVIGMGNVLMGDDGFGPNVIASLLACCDFRDDVSVMDLGTPGLDLTPYVVGVDALIIVDTVKSHGAPGELRLYRKDQILKYAPQPRLGPHDPGLKEALFLADLMGCAPSKVLLVGVIPEKTETGPGMTDAVRHAVSPAAFHVIREIEALGGGVTVRATPCPQEVWWESRPSAAAPAPSPESAAASCACTIRAAGDATVRPLMSQPPGRV